MSNQSENLKVIFFEPESDQKAGHVVADGYFSFVPTFQEGESINITVARKEATNEVVHDPIGHKTHRVIKTDWVLMIDEQTKNALATLVVSVSRISQSPTAGEFASVVATHS